MIFNFKSSNYFNTLEYCNTVKTYYSYSIFTIILFILFLAFLIFYRINDNSIKAYLIYKQCQIETNKLWDLEEKYKQDIKNATNEIDKLKLQELYKTIQRKIVDLQKTNTKIQPQDEHKYKNIIYNCNLSIIICIILLIYMIYTNYMNNKMPNTLYITSLSTNILSSRQIFWIILILSIILQILILPISRFSVIWGSMLFTILFDIYMRINYNNAKTAIAKIEYNDQTCTYLLFIRNSNGIYELL